MTLAASSPATARVPVRVHAMRVLARDIHLLELRRGDGVALPEAAPGAHIDVELPGGLVRQYSLLAGLSTAPGTQVIGVKRDPASRGGSRHLCGELRLNDTLHVSPPLNLFALAPQAPHSVLIAGGIGITPVWSMVRQLIAEGASWELHYAARSRADAALADELLQHPQVRCFFDDEHPGRSLDLAGIVERAAPDAHFYCCGPAPMLAAFEAATVARAPTHVHVEHFAPRTPEPSTTTNAPCTIRLQRQNREVVLAPGQSVLAALRAQGIDAPSSCEQGICGACETPVLEGEVEHRDSILSSAERAANASMMICCSLPRGPRLVLDL